MSGSAPCSRNELNFSGGPGALPECVLQQVREAIMAVPEVGLSVLGISHRSDWFREVVDETSRNIRELLGLGNDFDILFLQGGATQQFYSIPMAWLDPARAADYVHSGYWSGKSVEAARDVGPIRLAWNGEPGAFRRLPGREELALSAEASYFHYVSNETVEGLQFSQVMGRDDVPRICDMSSDFLSRPCEAQRYSMIYAHAQKNLGPAGVTILVLHKDWLARMNDIPHFLNYRDQLEANSILNTPPVFAIYVVQLVTRWLLHDIGGLAKMGEINQRKAALLYGAIDDSADFYRGRAARENRSLMNVAFNLPTPQLEQRFLEETRAAGISGLEGHRAIGGLRASLYNGMSVRAVEALANFMADFRARHAGASLDAKIGHSAAIQSF